jgi:hypothetical protein
MSDFVISLIRTWIPVAVGLAVAFLVSAGFDIDPDLEIQLSGAVVGLVSALYYGLARILEGRWPALGYLLGVAKPPAYPEAN